jgi:Essential protein Yae1, N terminal
VKHGNFTPINHWSLQNHLFFSRGKIIYYKGGKPKTDDMFRDDSFSATPTGSLPVLEDMGIPFPSHTPPPRHDNNSLDDVFGSSPASPTLSGSEPQSHHSGFVAAAGLSDIPRLRSEHSTAGYRDGLTTAKASTIQAGFDEGYSLGAVIGSRVGAVLGILVGVCIAVRKTGLDSETDRILALLERGSRELRIESVFAREWWGEDGIWKFEVRGEEGEQVAFKEVVDAHPLVQKWEGIVKDEAEKWGLDLGVLEAGEERRTGSDEPSREEAMGW